MKKIFPPELKFVLLAIVIAVALYWIVRWLVLPLLPDWLAEFILYVPRASAIRRTSLLSQISVLIGGISAVILFLFGTKK